MKIKNKIVLLVILICLFSAQPTFAALVKCGTSFHNEGDLQNTQTCTISNLFQEVFLVISFLIGSATLLTIGYVLYGGVRMILARGDPKRVQDAKSTMTNAIIGLIMVLLAYLIVNFVFGVFTGGKFDLTTALRTLNIK
jgi:hypothetical protein